MILTILIIKPMHTCKIDICIRNFISKLNNNKNHKDDSPSSLIMCAEAWKMLWYFEPDA